MACSTKAWLLMAIVAHAFSPSFAGELEDFHNWIVKIGGSAPNVAVTDFVDMGRGIAARHPTSEGDKIISIPMDFVMCRNTATKLSNKKAADLFASIQSDERLVAAFILYEKALGEKSKWAPYITVLQEHVPLPIFFSKSELAAFQDRALVADIAAMRRRVEGEFRALQPTLAQLFALLPPPTAGAGAGGSVPPPTAAEYKWAASLVGSRALTLAGKKYLVPFADMFNYRRHAEEREADSGSHFLKYHRMEDGFFNVYADRSARRGEQLFEDYGDNDNTLYLKHHGFVARNNPFDCTDLFLPSMKTAPHGSAKLRLMRQVGMSDRPSPCLSTRSGLPRHALYFLRLRSLSRAEVSDCAAKLKNDRNAFLGCLPGSLDSRFQSYLASLVKARLKAYGTTVDQDEALLASSARNKKAGPSKASSIPGLSSLLAVTLSQHETLAVEYRVTRKRVLRHWLAIHSANMAAQKAEQEGSDDPHADPSVPASEYADPGSSSHTHPHPNGGPLVDRVKRFNAWLQQSGSPHLHIEAAAVAGMRVGTVATKDIEAEEVYLAVPNKLLMDRSSAHGCPVLGPVYSELAKTHPQGDAFHELLLHLMYETFVVGADKSKWGPYISLLPSVPEMHFPAHFSAAELRQLQGSHALPPINKYRAKLERQFKGISKHVLSKFPAAFPPALFTLQRYKWAHSILDSRSIWWHGERHLVPLLDLINCVEGPDPSRVHSTNMDDQGRNAITRAPWAFKKGEQLFENYGQPNHIYFVYHGFSLAENSHDCTRWDVQPKRSDSLHAQRQRRLGAMGLRLPSAGSSRGSYQFCVSASNQPRALLAIALLNAATTSKAIAATRLDGASTKRARALLANMAEQRLAAYSSTLAEDTKALKTDKLSPHTRSITLFLASEKRNLKGLIRSLKPSSSARKAAKDEL